MHSVASRIRAVREKAGMRQHQFAEYFGVTPDYVSKVENERLEPSFDVLRKISSNFNCSIDYILNGSNYVADASLSVVKSPEIVQTELAKTAFKAMRDIATSIIGLDRVAPNEMKIKQLEKDVEKYEDPALKAALT